MNKNHSINAIAPQRYINSILKASFISDVTVYCTAFCCYKKGLGLSIIIYFIYASTPFVSCNTPFVH